MQQTVPDFQTHKDAERAFMDMLKRLNVTSEWTWERTMRETVMEPMYKALKTLAERKAAWEKFVGESVEREEEERKASLERCKKDWNRALEKLGGGPEREDGVKSWWRWETMGKKELERRMNPDVWDAPRNDEERKTLFEDFVQALKVREAVRSFLMFVDGVAEPLSTDQEARRAREEHGEGHVDPPNALAQPRRRRSLEGGSVDHLPHARMAARHGAAED
mgnify:FL=1